MRIVLAGVAGALLWAAGGCASDGGDAVDLTFVPDSGGITPALTGFHATNGTTTTDTMGNVIFTATSGDQTLTMNVLGPLAVSATPIPLNEQHDSLSFEIKNGTAGWSSNGGGIIVDGIKPYRVRFDNIPMLVGSGVTGTFTLKGSGVFK